MIGTPHWRRPLPSLATTPSMGSGWSRSLKTGASVASTIFPTIPRTAALGLVMLPAPMRGAYLKTLFAKPGLICPTISGAWRTRPQIVLLQVGN